MFDFLLGIVLVVVGVAVLGGLLKLGAGLLHLILGLVLLPFQLLGAVLAVVGGVLLLPVVLLGAVLTLLGLVAGFVVVPLLPVALVALAIVGMVRLLRPRRSHA